MKFKEFIKELFTDWRWRWDDTKIVIRLLLFGF
jgi:hypothetical protein